MSEQDAKERAAEKSFEVYLRSSKLRSCTLASRCLHLKSALAYVGPLRVQGSRWGHRGTTLQTRTFNSRKNPEGSDREIERLSQAVSPSRRQHTQNTE